MAWGSLPNWASWSRESAVESGSNSLTTTSGNASSGSGPSPSRLVVFGHLAFTVILIATSISSIGIAMFDTSMSGS